MRGAGRGNTFTMTLPISLGQESRLEIHLVDKSIDLAQAQARRTRGRENLCLRLAEAAKCSVGVRASEKDKTIAFEQRAANIAGPSS